jgi:hypothetical protein
LGNTGCFRETIDLFSEAENISAITAGPLFSIPVLTTNRISGTNIINTRALTGIVETLIIKKIIYNFFIQTQMRLKSFKSNS